MTATRGSARAAARHRRGDARASGSSRRATAATSSACRSRLVERRHGARGRCCSTASPRSTRCPPRGAAGGERRRRAARQRSRCCAIPPCSSTRTTIISASAAPVNGDSIYNGADDDASGVVAVLEIARALAAGPAPRRTVIFAATTGEEVGLLGTRWYLAPSRRAHRADEREPRDRDDRPSRFARRRRRAAPGSPASSAPRWARPSRAPACRSCADRRLDQQFFERSDNIAFARAGRARAHAVVVQHAHGLPRAERRPGARGHSRT